MKSLDKGYIKVPLLGTESDPTSNSKVGTLIPNVMVLVGMALVFLEEKISESLFPLSLSVSVSLCTQREGSHPTGHEERHTRNQSGGTSVLDFQPPVLWECKFLLFKLLAHVPCPNPVWYFLMAARADYDSHVSCQTSQLMMLFVIKTKSVFTVTVLALWRKE